MKTSLKLSVILNALLLGTLAVATARREKRSPVPVTSPVISESIPAPQGQAPQTFRWSQLESTNDYREYVANLRAIGCPEPTIRAIVTADFETAVSFEQHRRELAGENASSLSPVITRQAIARVLGSDAPASQVEEPEAIAIAAATSPLQHPALARQQGQITPRASYPIVFQKTVQSDVTLTDNQKTAVRQIQQQFADAVGSPAQNPADPGYSARWQTAQQDADDALRAQLGSQAYLSYKLQHYYANFQQVVLNAGDAPVTINPEQLAK